MNINSGLGAKKIFPSVQYLVCIQEEISLVLKGLGHGGVMSLLKSGITSISWEKNSTYSLNQIV